MENFIFCVVLVKGSLINLKEPGSISAGNALRFGAKYSRMDQVKSAEGSL